MPKANYDLPADTLQEVMKLSGAKSKREALVIAMEAYLKRKKLEKLSDSYGKLDLSWTQKSLKKYRT
jgi:hypothetical protein